jgi:hypothetical protein
MHHPSLAVFLVFVASVFTFGCTSSPEPIIGCVDARGIHPICGFQNPEDLSLLDNGRHLIVSQYGDMIDPSHEGSLAVLDLETEEVRVVYPGPKSSQGTVTPGWGDANCSGPATEPLNPHGIDMAARPDGRLQLLVVNHGGGESIEFFEVLPEADNVRLVWRGCVVPPEGAYFNDVVNLPDGGFLATHMMEYGSTTWGMMKAVFGSDTGFVYEWHANTGFKPVPGTEAPFPNGIEVSPDGSEIFLNVYMAGEVRRIDRSSGEVLAVATVPAPDNSSWSQDGHLLVASHLGGFSEQMPCMQIEEGPCPMSFEIVALDPVTLEGGAIFANRGEPMGGGTVGIDIGGRLVIGSFAGDRVIVAPFD